MGRIDVHTHAFTGRLAPRALGTLESASGMLAVGDGTVPALLRSMDASDVDVSVVCAIATKPSQVGTIFRWCRKIHSDRIEPFPSVHPATRSPLRWLDKFVKAHFSGIKLHPMYQRFVLDDPAMDAIYAGAAERGLVVAVHCGRDIGFPDDADSASPDRTRRVLDRHPQLKLLCTHLGGWRMWDKVRTHLLGTRALLETSFSLAELGPKAAAELIREHGADRVMMGSDWPWKDQAGEIALVDKLPLTPPETQAVLWKNAAGMLGY